jgi:cytoskeletal protein CcmA (bactofilin family)
MMFSNNVCRFAVFSFLSLSANADTDTVRGVQRQLEPTVGLGTAGDFVILAKTGITTTGVTSINGDIGVSPIAATAMTGFDFIMHSSGTYATSSLIAGKALASDYISPTPSTMITAVSDMETAYTDAAGRPNADGARIDLKAGLIGGETLTPGVYTFGTSVDITGGLTFDGGVASGDSDAVFIIQMTGNLLTDGTANVVLSRGAQAKNIFWQVAGHVALGAGAQMKGNLLVKTAVTFTTGSSLDGRVLAQTACVLQTATITAPSV